jgi:hypothetical protein
VRFFAGFDQVAYVTNDLDRAVELICGRYDMPEPRRIDIDCPARVGDVTGTMALRIAVSNLDGFKIELIEPVRDLAGLYGDRIAPDRVAGLAMHHLGVRVRGDDPQAYEHRLAELGRRGPVHVTGDLGADIRFAYTDERATLGHFVEHYWVRGQP